MTNSYLFGWDRDWETYSDEADAAIQHVAPASPTERLGSNAERLEDRLDRLILVNMALWSLIREKTGLTEEDLLARVQQIDLADGQRDGKATRPPVRCPECDRVMSPRHKRCLYCGTDKLDYTAFDAAR